MKMKSKTNVNLYLQVTKTLVCNLNNEVSHILSPLYNVVDIWLKLRDI
jgi:hypothetical protein